MHVNNASQAMSSIEFGENIEMGGAVAHFEEAILTNAWQRGSSALHPCNIPLLLERRVPEKLCEAAWDSSASQR